MSPFLHPVAIFQIFSLSASLVAVLTALAAGAVYAGRAGERYSPLNHFISELGEVGVSRLARVFNAGFVLTGLLLAACCALLGYLIPGFLSKLAAAAGLGTGAALALVGVFPMNHLTPHVRAAMTYFRLGLVTVLLFSAAIALQAEPNPIIPRAAAWAGLPAVLAYAAFILYSAAAFRGSRTGGLEAAFAQRPRVWPLAVLEWLIFLTTLLWFAAIALRI